jgi:ribosomal protein S18 acetylase RimI-like enzyme
MSNIPHDTIKIGTPVAEDAHGIQEVFYKTWLATYPNADAGITVEDIEDKFKDAFSEETLNKRREKIANPPEGQFLLIAKDDDKVVGLCSVIKEVERNKLSTLYVLPEYQGKGIGRALWERARGFLDTNKDTYLEVATYNANAIAFYTKLGFEDTGKRLDFQGTLKSGNAIPEMEMLKK